ncbi:MFS transporter [Actinocorallia libanotica]|uniref:Major facilitator superfamily (MFS) profile domain-containing protein n=1 Tax=Actinocorallia libanotica TaxID=46162 RepID=A0ABN1RTH3_9ACTN
MSARVLPLAAGATFLAMLDATVTNLAFPDLQRDLTGSTVSGLTWIVTLYAVAFAALLAPAGRLADLVGVRRLYRAGVGVFTLASLACALAPDLPVLLAARALQGAGAAAMVPASLAVLLHGTPPERRARAIGLWRASAAVAAAVGPSLGGVLVDAFGWRSLFFINLPLGLALLWAARALAPRHGEGRLPDLAGTVLLAGGLGAIALAVSQGEDLTRLDPLVLAALLGGIAAVAVALVRSARHPVPVLEISLWRDRAFAVTNAVSFFYGAAFFPWMLAGVLVLTRMWGYSELEAGLAMTPGALAAAAASVLMGRLATPRAAMLTGALAMLAAAVWTWLALPEEPRFLAFWLPCGLLVGAGMGALATGTAGSAALSVAPARFAGATGLNTTARQLGGALGTAVLAALLAGPRTGPETFTTVYACCAAACALALLAGLVLRTAAPSVSARTAEGVPA